MELFYFYFFPSNALSNGLTHTTEECSKGDIYVNESTNNTWTLCAAFEEAAPLKISEILLAAADHHRTLFCNDLWRGNVHARNIIWPVLPEFRMTHPYCWQQELSVCSDTTLTMTSTQRDLLVGIFVHTRKPSRVRTRTWYQRGKVPPRIRTHRHFQFPIHCWIRIKHCRTRGRRKLDFLWVAL